MIVPSILPELSTVGRMSHQGRYSGNLLRKSQYSEAGSSIRSSFLFFTASCSGEVAGNDTYLSGRRFSVSEGRVCGHPHLVFRGQQLVCRLLLGPLRLQGRRLSKRSCRLARMWSVKQFLRWHCLLRLEPLVHHLVLDICGQYQVRRRVMIGAEAKGAAVARVQRWGGVGRCG